jgi:hypothetical protein
LAKGSLQFAKALCGVKKFAISKGQFAKALCVNSIYSFLCGESQLAIGNMQFAKGSWQTNSTLTFSLFRSYLRFAV